MPVQSLCKDCHERFLSKDRAHHQCPPSVYTPPKQRKCQDCSALTINRFACPACLRRRESGAEYNFLSTEVSTALMNHSDAAFKEEFFRGRQDLWKEQVYQRRSNQASAAYKKQWAEKLYELTSPPENRFELDQVKTKRKQANGVRYG